MRNILIFPKMEDDHFISVNFSSNMSKDYQSLILFFKRKLNILNYPHQIAGKIN